MFHGFYLKGSLAIRLTAVLFLTALAAQAQNQGPLTNLQYFPKTISREELIGIMRGFSFSLNVRCQHCHLEKEGAQSRETDFASDEKETKTTARAMLRMTEAINQQYMAKLGRKSTNPVTCVTCHHGLNKPITMNALLAKTIDEKGIAAAIELYRELRKKGLGGGQYDFGETPLNQLTEGLLREKKTQAAAAIMELNVEVNAPPSMWTYNLLAMAHKANQETEKAKADFRKILELKPEDAFAKKQLEELNSGKQ
jgi:tetratricopeptide (TPR) repeat protein